MQKDLFLLDLGAQGAKTLVFYMLWWPERVRLRGGSGKLWASSGRPWEVSGGALGELRVLSIYTNSRSTALAAVMLNIIVVGV